MAKKKTLKLLKPEELPEDVTKRPAEIISKEQAVPLHVNPAGAIKDQDRITVQFHLIHEHCCVDPKSINGTFVSFLETMEQVFERRTTATKKWLKLDYGWLQDEGSGIVVVTNLALKGISGIKKEKRLEDSKKVLELGLGVGNEIIPLFDIKPSRFHFVEPKPNRVWYIRCLKGDVEFTITVLPK